MPKKKTIDKFLNEGNHKCSSLFYTISSPVPNTLTNLLEILFGIHHSGCFLVKQLNPGMKIFTINVFNTLITIYYNHELHHPGVLITAT